MNAKLAVTAVLLNFVLSVHGNFFLQKPGEFIIGQLLPLRKSYGTAMCAQLHLDKIIEAEALVYSVNTINNKNRGLSVGYDIVDTCEESRSEPQAQLDFAKKTWFEKETNISRVPAAVITDLNDPDELSSVFFKVRSFIEQSQNGLPLVSLKHPEQIWDNVYFMSPEKNTPKRVIIELVKHFEWNILDAIIYNDNEQFQSFKRISQGKDNDKICLLNELSVSSSDMGKSPEWFKKGKTAAPVMVVFASEDELPRLMSELDRYNLSSQDFILGSEILGTQEFWDDSFMGIIGIRRDSGNLKDFENYLATSELLERGINETFCANISFKNCEYFDRKEELIKELSWLGSSVIDAVYAIVEARKTGSNRLPKTGLTGIRVTSSTGRIVSFSPDRNIDEVKYDVLNFQKRNSDVKAEKIGEIEFSKKLQVSIEKSDIVWRSPKQPRSRCSADCLPGTRRRAWDESLKKCCWDCIRCKPGTVSSYANSTRCRKCPIGSKPTVDQAKCQLPEFDYLRWHEPFSLVMIFLLVFTVCFLVYTVNLYVKKANTPVFVKSKCASLPLLLSLFVTVVLPILLLMKPTESSCGAYNAIFMFSLGIPLTFLIARSHVIYNYCYNESGQLKRKWYRFNPQTAISFILIIIQLIFVVIHLSVAPVEVLVFNTTKPGVEYIECSSHSRPEFLPLVFFILGLVLAFNVLHMNEVSTPENLNEVKFVSMTVYFMYMIMFVYFVAVFGITGKKKIRLMCAMAFLLGFNFFTTIFLPKLYLILFRPEENLPEVCLLLHNEDENGNSSSRMGKQDCTDSPLLGLRADQFGRTEV